MLNGLKISATAFAVAAGSFLFAQTALSDTIRVAHADNAAHPKHLAFERFATLVAERSNGKFDVKVFHSGQLGGERELVEALQTNAVQITSVSNGVMSAFSNNFMLLDIPFLFENASSARLAIDAAQVNLFSELESIGIHGLAVWEQGFRELSSSEGPIATVADIEGMKIRTMEAPLHVAAWTAAGANPTPMSWGQVYPSLQTHVIDGQENPLYVVTQEKLFEVQKHVTLTHHIYDAMPVVASNDWWASLNAKDAKMISDAMNDATEYQRNIVGEEVDKAASELGDLGVTVSEFPPSERSALKAKAQPAVISLAIEALGADVVNAWLSSVGN